MLGLSWSNEKQFEKHYFATKGPRQQLVDLAAWRRHQMATVGRLTRIIKLVSSEQYSVLDHFVLELLQNADDNQYDSSVRPSVKMELFKDRLRVPGSWQLPSPSPGRLGRHSSRRACFIRPTRRASSIRILGSSVSYNLEMV